MFGDQGRIIADPSGRMPPLPIPSIRSKIRLGRKIWTRTTFVVELILQNTAGYHRAGSLPEQGASTYIQRHWRKKNAIARQENQAHGGWMAKEGW